MAGNNYTLIFSWSMPSQLTLMTETGHVHHMVVALLHRVRSRALDTAGVAENPFSEIHTLFFQYIEVYREFLIYCVS
jgi:hypothetical protein